MPEIDKWIEAQEFQISLDAQGKIIDFFDPDLKRENTPEERIRQKMVQIINHEWGYPKNKIGLERPINIGREIKRADIVVYNSATACSTNDQGNIFFTAEIKAPTIIDAGGQIRSYISATSAQGGFWTNGNKIEFYRKDLSSGVLLPWLGIPKHEQAWDSIGKYKKSDLIVPVDLKLAFRRCHNAIYRTGIDSEDIALDMVRIILSKIEDETSTKDECEFHITPEEYNNPKAREAACHRVRELFCLVRDRYKDVFTTTEEITASNDQLAIVISQLQQYSFMDSPHDVIGTAYETYVATHLKGERGQYFTNRLVVNMMVKMAAPDEKDVILDPACGSGGFILSAMNYIFDRIDESQRSSTAKEVLKRNAVHQLFGVDISPKLVKIAKANMLLGKDGHGGVEHGNSLDSVSKLTPKFNDLCGIGKPSIILTNPPFGSGFDLRIKEINILEKYQIGHQWESDSNGGIIYSEKLNDRQGVAPELLFLEKCLIWVKEGGIVGIVMAKGQLDNREALALRKVVCDKAQVLAVINLHEDTFEPFCGSKASVIFLKKTMRPLKDYRIFMAISNKVGQTSRGETIFKKDAEGNPVIKNGQHLLDEDLSEIADSYYSFKTGTLKESEFRFSIAFSELDKDSLSLNPVHYLPQHNAALKRVITIGERDDFEIHRLGDLANVYNGPRFKRPYAELGISSGPTIRKYFTGTALTQLNSDNVKYLDSAKATPQVQKQLDALTIYKGYILVSDSGTLGRVTYALSQHDGHIATNNLIRIVVDDVYLRGYLYEFLMGDLGQSLMLKNAYGTNQEHLEPDVIADIPIPIPKDRTVIEAIGEKVLTSIENLEASIAAASRSQDLLRRTLDKESNVL
ncbi:MAG: putative type I restriction enzymeP M protein [Firmicutes bacterium ADurb.Bin182]|nr:MAG: putative type I restriction enzymeP M protein [Firmicutes bacterium ADurb.Bin182]